MLRIGFDAKRAFLNHTGLGNYSRSVIGSLAAGFPGAAYYLYTTQAPHTQRTDLFFNRSNIHIRTPRLPFLRSLWRSRMVVPQLVRDRLDIYHGLSHEIPYSIQRTGIRTLVTIHDLIFMRYPQYYKAADRRIYALKFRNACTHAHLVIAGSEQTKRDVMHFLGTPEEKIRVVYQSCDPVFGIPVAPAQLHKVKKQYNLPGRYLLQVGTVEDRKNLMLTAQALPLITEEVHLVVIGKETPYAARVRSYLRRNGLEHRVHFLQNVPFTDLPAIYQQAEVFVYPSEFEGFGIPVLEALYSGVPVVAATGSCLEEVGGEGSLYVHPQDSEGLAAAINRVTGDTGLRSAMTAAGRVHAGRFTEVAQAATLMQYYRELAAK